jgi:hypothetical protein
MKEGTSYVFEWQKDCLGPKSFCLIKDCDDLSLAANGVLGLYLAMGEGSHSAAKEIRESLEGKLTEKIDLTIDVNRDVVERLQAARNRLAKCASDAETAADTSKGKPPDRPR